MIGVGIVTIGAALALTALERPLLASAVAFSGALPATILALIISRGNRNALEVDRTRERRNIGVAMLWTGAVVSIIAVVLVFVWPGALMAVLSMLGPGLLIGGTVTIVAVRQGR